MFILSDLYRVSIGVGNRVLTPRMKQIVKWDHPAGMKYIHFWAPLMKWSLVGAGFGDMLRPANKLSLNQSISLFATGATWSRYSMVIVPKNYMLFAVNIFLAFVGGQQVARIAHYRYTHLETPNEKEKQI
ncbi:unnamed protein product [Rotaria socialis]|uniref:Mitochondrial pyruvate carrier n=1 Tax=Rotaria socialis TaxID=392032 RepID=A0A820DWI2_9BILA|nr:unnamed protein product [Rotaria socialis]CAF3347806.1 unnamed protein product [Rotaria socialis]CAF3393534.1 unnamed protein product [Rotaria socialis]CAF3507742.1 unnamed protein product [Rotaria socialis]CAF3623266.1 unnamed protein product [Rotaria socialis]